MRFGQESRLRRAAASPPSRQAVFRSSTAAESSTSRPRPSTDRDVGVSSGVVGTEGGSCCSPISVCTVPTCALTLVDAVGRHQLANALRCGSRPTSVDGGGGGDALGCSTSERERRPRCWPPAHVPFSVVATAASLHGCTASTSRGRARPRALQLQHRAAGRGLVVHHSCFYHRARRRARRAAHARARPTSSPTCSASLRWPVTLSRSPTRSPPPGGRTIRRGSAPPSSSGCGAAAGPSGHGTRRAASWISASPRAESAPESWVRMLLIERGFPLPEVNCSLRSPAGREVYRLDLAWPALAHRARVRRSRRHAGREEQDAARADDLRRRGLDRRPRPGGRPRRSDAAPERAARGIRGAGLHLVRPVETHNTACTETDDSRTAAEPRSARVRWT